MRPQIPKSLLFLLVLSSAVALTASLAFRSKGQGKAGQESDESIREKLKKRFPIVDSSEPEPTDPQERAKRLKRSKKYNDQWASVGPELVQSAQGYHWPADFKAIPVSASDVVVVGTISDARAHVSEDKNSVYSEFTVTVKEVVKNGTGSYLGAGDSITLERKGGRVRYPSGHISWFFVVGQGLPGYQILDGRIEPLDDSPGVVHFQRYSGFDATAFLNEIRTNIVSAQPKN